jgi:Tol biopolymer transport system component
MPENDSASNRLDSWKEIAAYLKRNERTVIRWEKRGLPVYRVPGAQRQVVFAYKHELDDWLKGGDISSGILHPPPMQSQSTSQIELAVLDMPSEEPLSKSANPQTNLPPKEQPTEKPRAFPASAEATIRRSQFFSGIIHRKKWRRLAFTACAIILALVITIRLVAFHRPDVVRITRFQKLTDDGRAKINLRTDGTTLYFNQFEASREILMAAPIDSGSNREIDTPFANVDLQDISNDGQELLVTSFEGMKSGVRPLWVIPTRGGTPHRVGDVLCDFARWSPDNRKIACANGNSILVFDSDGSAVRTVGSFTALPRQLRWSADGENLRFVLFDEPTHKYTPWELAIREDGDTTIATASRLSFENSSICCWDWVWTRDNKNLLYTKSDRNGHPGLFLRPRSRWFPSEAEFPLKNSPLGDLNLGKTDTQLYLMIGDSPVGQLFKFDARLNGFQTLLHGLFADCLSFSPDGQWMTYITLRNQSLWRSRVDGSEAIQLTKPPMEAEYSAWSPDGRQIAFMGKQPAKPWRIFLVDRDGGEMQEAARGNESQGAPTWSADGTVLVHGNVACQETHSCWIRRIDVATGREEVLPGSNGFDTARWSPDGKHILALHPERHELMLFNVRTQHWKTLADSITGHEPNWSSDSQYIYVDTLEGKKPIIERVRISDGRRNTVVDLALLQKSSGHLDYWIGLMPDNSPILLDELTAVEAYVLEWTIQ